MPLQRRGGGRPVTNQSSSPFLSHMRGTFGTEMVRVLRNPGTEDAESFETEAHIQGKTGSFDINTPVFEGDHVELRDPRRGEDGVELRYVAKATVLRGGPENMHRVKAEWGTTPPPPRVAPVRRLSIENLHPEVQDAAGELFADGYYQPAVAEAFKSLEVRVRAMTGSSKVWRTVDGRRVRLPEGRPAHRRCDPRGSEREGRARRLPRDLSWRHARHPQSSDA